MYLFLFFKLVNYGWMSCLFIFILWFWLFIWWTQNLEHYKHIPSFKLKMSFVLWSFVTFLKIFQYFVYQPYMPMHLWYLLRKEGLEWLLESWCWLFSRGRGPLKDAHLTRGLSWEGWRWTGAAPSNGEFSKKEKIPEQRRHFNENIFNVFAWTPHMLELYCPFNVFAWTPHMLELYCPFSEDSIPGVSKVLKLYRKATLGPSTHISWKIKWRWTKIIWQKLVWCFYI